MPNHITNIVKANPETLSSLVGDDGIDFNCLISEPEGVNWYEWRISCWGTKWNAYGQADVDPQAGELKFQTAWSMPEKIAIALSIKNPDDEIVWIFADEDTGSNCGTIKLKGGSIIEEDCADGWHEMSCDERRKWAKFAFEITSEGEDPRDYGFDEEFNLIEE